MINWRRRWCGVNRYIFYFISTARHRSHRTTALFLSGSLIQHLRYRFTFPAVSLSSSNPLGLRRYCALGCMYAWLGSVFPCFLPRTWPGTRSEHSHCSQREAGYIHHLRQTSFTVHMNWIIQFWRPTSCTVSHRCILCVLWLNEKILPFNMGLFYVFFNKRKIFLFQ